MKFPVHVGLRKRRPAGTAPARFTQIIGVLGVLLLAGGLQACSAVKIAYNQGVELSFWQLDAYFDFNETQRPKVREELAKVHQWHRETQLPAYIDALQKWQTLLPGEISEAQACSIFDDVRGKLQAISDRALPAASTVVSTLKQDQMEALKRKFSKLNAEYRKDFLDGRPEALIDKRYKKSVSRAEMLYGNLDDQQLTILRNRIAQSAFDARMSLAEFQRRQGDALQSLTPLIAGQSTSDQAKPVVQAYIQRAMSSPNPAYRSYQERLTRDNCSTFAALHNSTTAAQRAKAVQTLTSYEQDFKILAAQR